MGHAAAFRQVLSRELAKAGIRTPAGRYVSAAATTSAAAFLLSTASFFSYLSGYRNAATYAMLISIPIGTIALSLFYVYPLMLASARAREIDENLPAALMHASAAGCTSTHSLFRMLSGRGKYGALSEEARRGLHYTYSLGTDGRAAALKVAESSPSAKLRDFLHGLPGKHENTSWYIEAQAARMLSEQRRRTLLLERKHTHFAEGYAAFLILAPILLFAFAHGTGMLWLGAYLAMPLANALMLLALYRMEE